MNLYECRIFIIVSESSLISSIIASERQKDNKYYCVIKNSNEKEHSNYNQRESSSKYSSGIGLYIISEIFELEQIEYGIYIYKRITSFYFTGKL